MANLVGFCNICGEQVFSNCYCAKGMCLSCADRNGICTICDIVTCSSNINNKRKRLV